MKAEQAQTDARARQSRTDPEAMKLSMQDKFRPLHDQILVKREDSPRMSGLIHLPDNAQVQADGRGEIHQGIVVALGPGDLVKCVPCGGLGDYNPTAMAPPDCPYCNGSGMRRYPIDLKLGDRILFWFHMGADVTIDGEQFIVLHEEQHVQGVLEN
jgi:co-chaperonin GroES (HSP10)